MANATASDNDRASTLERRRRIARVLTWVTVIVTMTVSSLMLIAVGIPYFMPGGSILTKIHPATYLAVVTVLTWGWASGGLTRLVGDVAVRHPGAVAFTLGVLLLGFQAAVVVKLPLTPILDTFVLPILLFVALSRLDQIDRDRMETMLHIVVAANSVLAIFEYTLHFRFTPLYEPDGRMITYEWRSSAFFGQPLINSYVTGNYVALLAFGASPRMRPILRLAAMALSLVAMVAYGGRVAMAVTGALLMLAAALGLYRMLTGGRFATSQAAVGLAFLTVAAIFVVIFVDGGGADRFLSRFSQDHGSAQTRISMMRIFGELTWEQFLLWPDADLIWQAQREYDIRIGVESSEVAMASNYGVLVAIVFFLSFFLFLRDVVLSTSKRAFWSTFYFVGVMSTSIGVASKTTVLAMHVVFTMILAGPERADASRDRDTR